MHVELTDYEVGLLAGLLRAGIRHEARKRRALIEKFGDAADASRNDGRMALLESIYRKIDKDPAEVTNRVS